MAGDHDLCTADVRRLLDHPAGTTGVDLSRRRFLLAAAAGAAATALPVPHLLGTAGAQTVGGAGGTMAAPATGAVDDVAAAAAAEAVLVIILMGGGNDGLSTLVPTGDADYYAARGALAIPGDRALDVGGGFGLHPNLGQLKRRFDSGQVAAVRGVGYANPDLSHFSSMALWMQGSAAGGPPTSGWVGRYLDGLGGGPDDFHGIAIGSSVPLHVVGNATRATALPTDGGSLFGADRSDATDARMFDCLSAMGAGSTGRGQWADAWARTGAAAVAQAQRVAGMYVPELPDRDIASQLVLAARLITAGLGIRIITTDFHGDFDTHASQPAHHDALMQELDDAIEAFYAALGANHVNRVVLMTMSEFGRRLRRNDSNGTDHGTASTLLVIGNRVRGGLHGTPPDLAHPDRNGNLVATVDFRSVYASVLGGWLGADANQVLGAAYPALDLFTGPAGWTFPGIDGYWLATASGSVYTFGTAGFYGSVSGPAAPIAGMCATPTRKGYWLCERGRRRVRVRRRRVPRLGGQRAPGAADRRDGVVVDGRWLLAGGARRRGLLVRRRPLLRLHRRHPPEPPGGRDVRGAGWPGLLVRGHRRRHLQLRRRRPLPWVDRCPVAEPARRGHDPDELRRRLLDGGERRRHLRLRSGGFLRLDGRDRLEPADRRDGRHAERPGLLADRSRRRRLRVRRRPLRGLGDRHRRRHRGRGRAS